MLRAWHLAPASLQWEYLMFWQTQPWNGATLMEPSHLEERTAMMRPGPAHRIFRRFFGSDVGSAIAGSLFTPPDILLVHF